MELTDDPSGGGSTPIEPIAPCLSNADEHAAFLHKSSDFGATIYCYIWHTGTGKTVQVCGGWPGQKAQALGDDNYKFAIPESAGEPDNSWMIIWNDGSGNQTQDLVYKDQYLYSGANKGSIKASEVVTELCGSLTGVQEMVQPAGATECRKLVRDGRLYILLPDGRSYDMLGQTMITPDNGSINPR